MKYNIDKNHRRSIRLNGYDYSKPGMYFVTICSKDRECVFGEVVMNRMCLNQIGKIVYNCWHELFNTYNNIKSDAFIVMPNHIHGIIFIQYRTYTVYKNQPLTLSKIIRHYKARVSKIIREKTPIYFQWQRNYYDSIIFNNKSLLQMRQYIMNNPASWGTDLENLGDSHPTPENKATFQL